MIRTGRGPSVVGGRERGAGRARTSARARRCSQIAGAPSRRRWSETRRCGRWGGSAMTAPQGSVGAVPRVSVVVPIYDVEPFIEDCLASLQAQTLRDLEVVMVDDGSHDRGPDIAGGFVELDRRFRLIRQANGGLGHARNVGVQASTGDFITFLD